MNSLLRAVGVAGALSVVIGCLGGVTISPQYFGASVLLVLFLILVAVASIGYQPPAKKPQTPPQALPRATSMSYPER